METIPIAEPVGGLFYQDPSPDSLRQAIECWDRREHEIKPADLQAYAAKFSEAEFSAKMRNVLGLVANL
jgi:hypothetical protein